MFKKKDWVSQLNITQIIIALILGLAILGYGYMNNQAKQGELNLKQAELEQKQEIINSEKEEEADNKSKYSRCVLSAGLKHSSWWERSCESKNLDEDCRLPLDEGDVIRKSKKEELDRCVTLYK